MKKLNIKRKDIGRSMVEMLSVLAIIGVITVGTFYGIRYLLARSQAVKILSDVKMFHMLIEENNEPFDEWGRLKVNDFRPEANYTYTAESPAEDYYRISVLDVPENVCHAVLNTAGKNPFENRDLRDFANVSKVAILVDDKLEWYDGKNKEVCQEGNNEIMFFFGSVSEACYRPCEEEDEWCYYGKCCARTNQCYGDCCKAGEICCNGGCHDASCPTDDNGIQLKKNKSCVCECPIEKGFKPLMENGKCVCNPDKGFTLQNGSCGCAADRVNLNGECTVFGCYTAENRKIACTSGSGCHCFIGDKRCGYNCLAANVSSCYYGFCYDACMGNEWEYNPGTRDYACTTTDDRFQCEKFSGNLNCMEKGKDFTYFCGKNCNEDGSNCAIGDCKDVCKGKTYNGNAGVFARVGVLWGCQYGDVTCYKQTTVTSGAVSGQGPKYFCYKNDVLCAQNCSNPLPMVHVQQIRVLK